MTHESLPEPVVPPEVYSEEYYQSCCLGSDEWQSSEGERMHPIYPYIARLLGIGADQTLVDVGCGRGELLVAASEVGAGRSVGIEYSAAAIELARATLFRHGIADRCEVRHADARALPLDDDSADHVTMLDVVEHLSAQELNRALQEARRVLVPGGQLLIHTMPNRLIFSVTYRLQRIMLPWRLATWPPNPRMEPEQMMHVNEQTAGSLRRALRRTGFKHVRVWLGRWVREDFQPDRRHARIYRRLAKIPVLDRFGIADLFATARCPPALVE